MLDETDISALGMRLDRMPDLQLALLFGSMASGRAGSASDVDLALLCRHPLSSARRLSLVSELSLLLDREIDLVDLHGVPEPISGEALRGRRLIDRDGAWVDLMNRHLVNVEDFLPLQQRLFAERRRRILGA